MRRITHYSLAAIFAAFAATGFAAGARAADYPSNTVRIIVPSTPGGALDVLARVLAPPLGEKWKQSVIVDNRAGANGIIGTEAGVQAKPDGLTLTILSPNFTINPFIYKKLPYDTKDLLPLTIVGQETAVLVVNPTAAKFRTLKGLIDFAKSSPGAVTYSSSGIGSSGQMQMVLLEHLAGVKFLHVPFSGAGAATTAVVSGQVTMLPTAVGTVLSLIKSNNLIPIAVTGLERSKVLPDVPTIAESGFPGYNVPLWYGMFVTAATPKDIVAKIYTDIAAVLKDPAINAKIVGLGFEVGGDTPDHFQKFIDGQLQTWKVTVKEAGIEPQ